MELGRLLGTIFVPSERWLPYFRPSNFLLYRESPSSTAHLSGWGSDPCLTIKPFLSFEGFDL